MLHIHNILFPTDFSARAVAAFHLACALARDHGAHLTILHVREHANPPFTELGAIPPTELPSRREVLNHLDEFIPNDEAILFEQVIADGNPSEEIVRLAVERNCDMIVMGAHGRTGLSRLLMGSVAEQVVRKASCPVVTLKNPMPAAETVDAMRTAEWATM